MCCKGNNKSANVYHEITIFKRFKGLLLMKRQGQCFNALPLS
jgi:hypothetical protein